MLAERIANWKNRYRHEQKQRRGAESSHAYAVIPETSNQNEFISCDSESDNKPDDIISRYQALEPKHKVVLAEIANTGTRKMLKAQCQTLWPDVTDYEAKILRKYLS